MPAPSRHGFTLIELSIVLVIIGLVVGGVMVGRDLIKSSEVRAAISQIDMYNAAVHSFRLKYNYLPGDIPEPDATSVGFVARGQYAGEGDGNGVLEGVTAHAASSNLGAAHNIGELSVFWRDLGKAGLVNGEYNIASSTVSFPQAWLIPADGIIPESKLGGGNYVYVWSGGWSGAQGLAYSDRKNYFGIIKAKGGTYSPFNSNGATYWEPGLTVDQAYNIDVKMDDGYPQSGTVQANYIYNNVVAWAMGDGGGTGGYYGAAVWPTRAPTTASIAYHARNCYDNNGVAGVQRYSLSNANAVNCALSFRFR